MVRLQKYIAECGVTSRRKAEELIQLGRVWVNGAKVTALGSKVDPLKDKVAVDGKAIHLPATKVYFKFYKPAGVVSSCRRFSGEKSILDYIKDIPQRVFPVGRLDKDSEGLMLLTNDGDLANRLMHPRYEHEKEYLVQTKLTINNEQLTIMERGIVLSEGKTLLAKVVREGTKKFRITLKEGKKRQIRRMVEAVGNQVVELQRIRIGNIRLGDLEVGRYSPLSIEEIGKLKR